MMMMMMRELRWKVNKPTVFIWLNPIKQIKISKFFQRWCCAVMLRHMLWEFEWSVILARERSEKSKITLVFDEKVSWWLMWKNLLFHFCGITSTEGTQSDGQIFSSWKLSSFILLVFQSEFEFKKRRIYKNSQCTQFS
jgi:hypothetical protein